MFRSPSKSKGKKSARMMSGSGIHIKSENKGKLHADLGVPQGEKIPAAKLEAAKADASPAKKARIQFALNAREWNHK